DLGDREDGVRLSIGHHRAGDAEGVDVAARQRGERHWRADVDMPDDGAVVGIEAIDGVVLGGGDDPVGGHDGLAVDGAVEVGRPGVGAGEEVVVGGVDAGAVVVGVVGGPGAAGGGGGGRGGENEGGEGEGCGGVAAHPAILV